MRTPPDAWVEALGLDQTPNLPPRYNIAPTQEAAVVCHLQERESALPGWLRP